MVSVSVFSSDVLTSETMIFEQDTVFLFDIPILVKTSASVSHWYLIQKCIVKQLPACLSDFSQSCAEQNNMTFFLLNDVVKPLFTTFIRNQITHTYIKSDRIFFRVDGHI